MLKILLISGVAGMLALAGCKDKPATQENSETPAAKTTAASQSAAKDSARHLVFLAIA
ncbi:hypothetical protein [Paraflavitalea speifideaquila]|uniref:hypothetical protein n=1 Tax=Paraflavitalea speifideaquila TaxID=3076558 RepID=UPI0028EAE383|nr:hypothetical protein [Paraflavitalea speifideiaquila]